MTLGYLRSICLTPDETFYDYEDEENEDTTAASRNGQPRSMDQAAGELQTAADYTTVRTVSTPIAGAVAQVRYCCGRTRRDRAKFECLTLVDRGCVAPPCRHPSLLSVHVRILRVDLDKFICACSCFSGVSGSLQSRPSRYESAGCVQE